MVALRTSSKMSEQEYIENALANITIDENKYGEPFARIISHSGNFNHIVKFVEPLGQVPHATHCTCTGYRFRLTCVHADIVDLYYEMVYGIVTTPAIYDDREALARECDAIVAEIEAEMSANVPVVSQLCPADEDVSAAQHIIDEQVEAYGRNIGDKLPNLRGHIKWEGLNVKSRDAQVLKAALLAHRRAKLVAAADHQVTAYHHKDFCSTCYVVDGERVSVNLVSGMFRCSCTKVWCEVDKPACEHVALVVADPARMERRQQEMEQLQEQIRFEAAREKKSA